MIQITKRQQDVVNGIAFGMPHREIGKKLGLSTATVSTIAWRLQGKFNVKKSDQLPGAIEFKSWSSL